MQLDQVLTIECRKNIQYYVHSDRQLLVSKAVRVPMVILRHSLLFFPLARYHSFDFGDPVEGQDPKEKLVLKEGERQNPLRRES